MCGSLGHRLGCSRSECCLPNCLRHGLVLAHFSMLAGQGASGDLAIFDVVELEPHSTMLLFFLVFWGYPDVQSTVI